MSAPAAWRTSPEAAVASLVVLGADTLTSRLSGEALASLAGHLGVPRSGRKADVAARIVERAALLDRMRRIGTDPREVARVYKRASLVPWAKSLGVWPGGTKYALAAQIITRTAYLYQAFGTAMAEGR
jgi:hypothetical protein